MVISKILMSLIFHGDDKVCDQDDGDEVADNGDDYPKKVDFWKWSCWSL